AAQTLPQRRARDRGLEVADQVAVAAEREIAVEPILERPEPQLLQPLDLAPREALAGELRQRRPPPQRQRLRQQCRTGARVVDGARFRDEPLEPAQVELLGTDVEDVASAVRAQPVAADE